MKAKLFAAILAGAAGPALCDELPIKQVTLSTSGLAQFTHGGEAAAGTRIDLQVRLDQVDDLLKSLTIFDKAGAIGAVTLPGKSPLSELFRDLPFGQDALLSQSELLNTLAGSEVEIEGQVNAKGRVFRVEEEKRQLPNNGGETLHHRITLLTANGFVQAILEDLSAVRFLDTEVKAQVEKALAGLAQNRTKDRRTLSIVLSGESTRPVAFSYVVAAPVWKTAYRLVLPKEGGRARLQGWGILENLTGSDWKDVDVSLVSGNPVALRQSLYSAFYLDRPEIPVSSTIRLVPKRDDAEAQNQQGRSRERNLTTQAPPPPLPAAPAGQLKRNLNTNYETAALADATQLPDSIASSALSTEVEEDATQVLYRFPAALSLPSGSTMMVPFVDRDITVVRAWLYQPDTNARRPLAAVRLKNDGDAALPGGIITAFDASATGGGVQFAGDAQLPLMPKNATKFVTFALDTKTDIRRTDNGIKQTRLGKAINGQLTLTVKSRWAVDYEITPAPEEDREITIDEARVDRWKPASDMKDVEETPSRLRFKVTAAKGATTKASLIRENVELQLVALTSLDTERLLATVSGLENESAALKEAVAKLSGIVAEINQAKAKRTELEEERRKLADDQARLRNNLSSVGQSSDLGRRYIDALRVQEDRFTAIAAEDKTAATVIATKRKAAETIARDLSL